MKTKMMETIGTAALIVLLGAGTYGYAAQEHQGAKQAPSRPQQAAHAQARPAQQHAQPQARQQPRQAPARQPAARAPQKQQAARAPQARPQQKPQVARAPQKQQVQQRQPTQQARGNGNQRIRRTPQQQQFQQSAWQQHRAGNWQSDHRTWSQRGGYNGYRIPDDRFRGYFGQGHGFRIGGLPFLVVGGYPRFQYGGYWFSMVDPYPGNWASNWYDTDDVYVNYVDNGYYLYDTRYPGVGLAISISM